MYQRLILSNTTVLTGQSIIFGLSRLNVSVSFDLRKIKNIPDLIKKNIDYPTNVYGQWTRTHGLKLSSNYVFKRRDTINGTLKFNIFIFNYPLFLLLNHDCPNVKTSFLCTTRFTELLDLKPLLKSLEILYIRIHSFFSL